MPLFIRILNAAESITFYAILVFTPLSFGAAPKWAFCISVWMGMLAFSGLLLKRLWLNQTLLPRTVLAWPLGLLVLLSLASLFTSIYPTATLWALARLILYVAAFYLALETMASRKQAEHMILLIFCTGASLAFLGFVKYAGAPFPSFWMTSGNGLERELTATFLNHNHLAGYLEMVFPLGLGLLIYNRSILHPLLWSFLLILMLAALFFSMSRGGWIAVLIASALMLATFAWKKGPRMKRLSAVLAVVLLVAGISFLGSNAMIERLQSMQNPDEPNLASIRLPAWAASLQLIHENPWLGTGLGTFPWSFTAVRPAGLAWRFQEAHNDYLQIVTEIGLPVLIPIFWGIYLIFRIGFRALQQSAGQFRAGVSLGALGGITAILAHSLTDFNVQITSNGVLFSVLVGMIAGLSSRQRGVGSRQ